MYRITDNILIGGLFNASDESFIRDNCITAVLNVCYQRSMPIVAHAWLPLHDNAKLTANDLKAAVETLRNWINAGHVVLVHCFAGVSRSTTVVATYLAQENHWTWGEAIQYVKKRRPITNPNIELVAVAKEILGNEQA
jgi:protein-tyrosine phosphatase